MPTIYKRRYIRGKSLAKKSAVTRAEAFRIANKVYSKNTEDKQSYLEASDVEVPSTGYIRDPSLIGQGTTVSQRVGNKIKAKSLVYKWIFTSKKAADATGPQYVRLMIVRAYGQLTSADMPSTVQESPNFEKYWVYKDELTTVHTIQSGATTNVTSVPSRLFQGRIKLNHTIAYDDALTNPEKGAVFCFMLSNYASGNEAPVVRGRCILRYEDA